MRADSGDTGDGMDRFGDYEGMALAVLRRYVKERSDAVERRRVEAWAAESVERRRYLATMRRLLERAPRDSVAATESAWERIAERLEPPATPEGEAPPYVAPWEAPPVRVPLRRRRPRILTGAFADARQARGPALLAAASVVVVLAGGALIQRTGHPPAPPRVPETRLISTAKGQRAEIRLADGSLVVLGVDSRLRFVSTFGQHVRDLYLDGTAYFDVVHDSTRPLRIHTADAVTEDIGTRFVVSAYRGSGATQVVVAAGTVRLAAARDRTAPPVTLTAGHLGRVASDLPAPLVRTVDPAAYTAWMQGRLVFRDTPLADVVAELRRWYDVDVRIGDPSLARVPLSASFTAESFSEALQVVTTVLPLRAVRRGNVVTLSHR